MTPSKYILKTMLAFSVALSSLFHAFADGLPSAFRYELVEADFAYSDKMPDDVITPLMVLDLSTGCTNWESVNNAGFEQVSTPIPGLETAACTFRDSLPVEYRDSFVFGTYGMYPNLLNLDRGAAHEEAFNDMKDLMDANFGANKYYLMIGTQINPEDGSVIFKFHMKLPETNQFEGITKPIRDAMTFEIEGAVSVHYNELQSLELLPSYQSTAIDKLRELLAMWFSGNVPFYDESYLVKLGFDEIPLASGNTIDVEETYEPASTSNVFDYAGLKVGGQQVSSNISGPSSDLANFGLTSAFVLTAYNNIGPSTGGSKSAFDLAYEKFESLKDPKIVLWVHYFKDISTNKKALYIKYKDNFEDKSEADPIVIKFWNAHQSNLTPLPGAKGENDAEKTVSDCSLWKWRAIDCFVPKLQSGEIIIDSLYADKPAPVVVAQNFGLLLGGLVCGIADGFIETASFIGHAGKFLVEAQVNSPLSPAFWGDLLFEAAINRSLSQAWSVKIDESKEFWTGVYDGVKAILSLFPVYVAGAGFIPSYESMIVYRKIYEAFYGWLKDTFFGASGTVIQGYNAGKIVFEIILTILTGGYHGLVKVAQFTKVTAKRFIKAIGEGADGLKGFLDDMLHLLPDGKKKLVQGKILGCFIAGTPVWTAGGQVVIDKIRLQPALTTAKNIQYFLPSRK